MLINGNFNLRAASHSDARAWVPSPMPGVSRRMLDRVGGEIARATSVVRYAPGSRFSSHAHAGGEEFFVLDGTFEDEHGSYPAGTYVRNPPGTSHAPSSSEGCTMLVKLWQFDAADRNLVRLAVDRISPRDEAAAPGATSILLHQDSRETVTLETWASGVSIHRQPRGGIELFVVGGSFDEGGEAFQTHSWLRLPDGAALRATAGPRGARVWIKEGHLLYAHAADAP